MIKMGAKRQPCFITEFLAICDKNCNNCVVEETKDTTQWELEQTKKHLAIAEKALIRREEEVAVLKEEVVISKRTADYYHSVCVVALQELESALEKTEELEARLEANKPRVRGVFESFEEMADIFVDGESMKPVVEAILKAVKK